MEYLLLWSRRLLWPALLIVSWWSWRIENDFRLHLAIVLMLLASLFAAWWQKRNYLAAVSLLFIGMASLFSYLQYAPTLGPGTIAVYAVLFGVLWLGSLTAFQTYLLSPHKPVVFAYLASVVFICLEIFWLMAMFTADPIIRSAVVVCLFHILFALVALNEWGRLKHWNFRLYILSLTMLIAVFLRLM